MSAEEDDEQSSAVWEQAPWSAFLLAEFIGYLLLIWLVTCLRSRCLRSRRSTTLKSKIASILMVKTRPFWLYSYILWKAVYRNIRHLCINLVANIIWGTGHPICSSFLLDFSFLHHDCQRVFTVFYVIAMLHFLAAKLYFRCTRKWSRRTH